MPTTKLKNTLYRAALPFCAPNCGRHPVSLSEGHPVNHLHEFEFLLRRHHVLGAAVLLTSGSESALICSDSVSPRHVSRPDTLFRVASITKTATSVLCMRLADLGILDPDAPVSACFHDPAASAALEGITLRHLLSHTSGLADPPLLEQNLEKGVPFTDILPGARHDRPGISFRYSNLGFGIVGCVLEAVLDKPVGQIFSEYLFSPLKMNASLEGCLLPAERIMPVTRILPYRKGHDLILTPLGSKPLTVPDPLRHYGHTAGSLYTDISSLQNLYNVLILEDIRFLSGHARTMITSEHASYGSLSPTLSYGLGLLRISDDSVSRHTVLGHQGFAYGCADGAFWEENTCRSMIMLNGGSSEARVGRLGILNRDMMRWAFRKELPSW